MITFAVSQLIIFPGTAKPQAQIRFAAWELYIRHLWAISGLIGRATG
jgi:hypothetical protein